MPLPPPFSEAAARTAISESVCWADALRKLGYESKGANYRTLQRWVKVWEISTDHFDPDIGRRRAGAIRRLPLKQVLVENSTYNRGALKRRLLSAGLKRPVCELCGQDEVWQGKRMSLVLDHINGTANDHRLENLRIVCPNCAATFETHCGRNLPRERKCAGCGQPFVPTTMQHRYCSQTCWGSAAQALSTGIARPETRRVERPSPDQLKADLASMSVLAVGRKYGVSDNAIRKWLRWYERQAAREAGDGGDADAQAA